jgi:hypothetical protein
MPRLAFAGACVLVLSAGGARAATNAWGTINNFDCVNDNGVECHGFEIEIEDCRSRDITYTYSWNHYGTPTITEDLANPLHPRTFVRYASAKRPDGTWAAYTAVPSGPILPTDGHQFTNPSTNFGGEHFGVGCTVASTNISYHWLVDNGAGLLVRGTAVAVSTPTFIYYPPAAGAPAQVQAVIQPPPPPEVPPKEFGDPSWVKEIRTTSHNNNEVKLRDLVSDDPDDPDDKNWRNGEPDEVEVEWQLLQTEFNKVNGGANGELAGAPEDLPNGNEIVTRRYEFYRYIGPIDLETGEAMADSVGPDGSHGVGIKEINGVEVDLSTVEVVGEFIGSQMAAFDAEAAVGLIDHVQDGVRDNLYPARRLVITGNAPFTATNWGVLPAGITFDVVAGELSGTPTLSGVFPFTVEARAGTNPPVRKTYVLTIAEPGEELPPHSTVDTLPSPLDAGVTSGDGSYTNDTTATVTATPAAGFAFANWTDNGKVVSRSARYTFTNIINRSLVANFMPGPTLAQAFTPPNTLTLSWPTNFSAWKLQESPDLSPNGWTDSTRPADVSGDQKRVTIWPLTGRGFFRLVLP